MVTVAAGAARPHQDPQNTFRSSSRVVAVYATVRESDGRLVPNLTKDDFEILDNGKPAPITTFSNEILPFTVVLLLDMSNSVINQYPRILSSAQEFVDHLLPADRVRIGTFGREVSLSPLLTGDKQILRRILDEEVWPGGATPLWRAADAGMTSLSSETGRRVVLFLTDGSDSGKDYNCAALVFDPHGRIGPCPDRDSVRKHALSEEFMLYGIGLEHTGLDASLTALTNETGGGHFEVKSGDDLSATFLRVADELHHQYVLGFTPISPDGKTHKIEVKLNRPGLTAQARKSYEAK
jgi:Ca-activated chloride channel family protein